MLCRYMQSKHAGETGVGIIILILDLARRHKVVGGQYHAPAAVPQGRRPGTDCTGGWVSLGASLNGSGKISSPTGVRNPNLYTDRTIRLILKISINNIRLYNLTSDIITLEYKNRCVKCGNNESK